MYFLSIKRRLVLLSIFWLGVGLWAFWQSSHTRPLQNKQCSNHFSSPVDMITSHWWLGHCEFRFRFFWGHLQKNLSFGWSGSLERGPFKTSEIVLSVCFYKQKCSKEFYRGARTQQLSFRISWNERDLPWWKNTSSENKAGFLNWRRVGLLALPFFYTQNACEHLVFQNTPTLFCSYDTPNGYFTCRTPHSEGFIIKSKNQPMAKVWPKSPAHHPCKACYNWVLGWTLTELWDALIGSMIP